MTKDNIVTCDACGKEHNYEIPTYIKLRGDLMLGKDITLYGNDDWDENGTPYSYFCQSPCFIMQVAVTTNQDPRVIHQLHLMLERDDTKIR